MTKNITLVKVKGQKTHFSKLRDQKHTFSKIKGPKTHFSKLRDQNMTLCKLKGPKTYFSQKTKNIVYFLSEFQNTNLTCHICYMLF